MIKKFALSGLILLTTLTISAQAHKHDSVNRKYFISTSAFVLSNLIPNQTNPPNFYQLNVGYRLTSKEAISIEAITWKFKNPIGIPYGPSFEDLDEAYPGYIKEFGVGLAYQRFLWKGLYAATHALPLHVKYMDEQNNKIQTGFKLFLTLRTGYHIALFKNRVFIEPSIACTYWPINTNVPIEFEKVESKWPNYFLFEPGLHCGFNF